MVDAQVLIFDRFNVANKIWIELREVLNKISNFTCIFLQNLCKAQENHSLMSSFRQEDAPIAVLNNLTRWTEEEDSMFNKEGVHAIVNVEKENKNIDEK